MLARLLQAAAEASSGFYMCPGRVYTRPVRAAGARTIRRVTAEPLRSSQPFADAAGGADRLLANIETVVHGKREEVRLVLAALACGGHALTSGAYARGFFHEPTIFADVAPSMRIAQEEIFGPVVSVIPCRSFEEAIAIGNGVEYGLSASIYTQDVNRAFAAMRDMYTGIFYVNAGTIGAEVHLPFGGTKATGNGHREAGTAALDVFSEWKSIYVDFSGKLQRAQIDTAEL